MEKIGNNNGSINSLQISYLGKLPRGGFKSDIPFLVKNMNNVAVEVEVKLASMNDFIITTLYPGWNVELIKEIKDITEDNLQYGY